MKKLGTVVEKKSPDESPSPSPSRLSPHYFKSHMKRNSIRAEASEPPVSVSRESKNTYNNSSLAGPKVLQARKSASPSTKNSDFSRQQLARKRKEQLEKKKRNYLLSNKIDYSDTNLININQVLAEELLKNDNPGWNDISNLA